MQPCANCAQPFDSAFCPSCGQKRVVAGIRFTEVIGEFLAGIYNVDTPLLLTLRTFFKGPAGLTRAFLAGKRKAFTPPVRYFLFGIAVYYFVRFLLNWDPVDAAVQSMRGAPPIETPAMRVNHWMSRNVNLLLPILMLMLATTDRLLFPRTELRWVERLVHYLFATGTYLLVSSTLLLLTPIWPQIQFLNFLVIFGVLSWAAIALHRRGVWTVIKAIVMVPVCFLVYVVLCSILVALLLGVPLTELVVRPS